MFWNFSICSTWGYKSYLYSPLISGPANFIALWPKKGKRQQFCAERFENGENCFQTFGKNSFRRISQLRWMNLFEFFSGERLKRIVKLREFSNCFFCLILLWEFFGFSENCFDFLSIWKKKSINDLKNKEKDFLRKNNKIWDKKRNEMWELFFLYEIK